MLVGRPRGSDALILLNFVQITHIAPSLTCIKPGGSRLFVDVM